MRPGAVTGTLLWFPATLAFGWYVTRIADYSMFYGSFGAGIATLVWLYITAFSVLIGAELNGALFRERQADRIPPIPYATARCHLRAARSKWLWPLSDFMTTMHRRISRA